MTASERDYTPNPAKLIGEYFEEGWKLLRLHPETKKPVGKEWQRKEGLSQKVAKATAEHGIPIGVQVGEVSGWLCCVDLDSPEAIKLAPHFLPATLKAGKGGEVSHYVYYSEGLDYEGFRAPDNSELISLKAASNGQGHQFVVAPSVHPTKGPYEWAGGFDSSRIARVGSEDLRDSVRHLAASALIAGALPEKGRHHYSLAVAGYLLRSGLERDRIGEIMLHAWEAENAPRDGIVAVVRNVHDTAEKLERGEPITGGPTLDELVPGMARKLARFLGLQSAANDEEGERESDNALLAGRFDLGAAMTKGIDPPDELEPNILLKGKIHHLFGPSESGKTFIALWLIKRRIEARQYVIFFDSENGQRTITERLGQMGADPELVRKYLVYLPFPDLTASARSRRDFYNALDEIAPALIVFDSWASFLSAAGFSENENSEIEDWDNAHTKRAKQRGIASLILDHTPHDGIRSRGGARKKEVADVQWRVKKTLPFNRDTVGEVILVLEKDREGWMPGSVTFSIGGDGGEMICRPTAGTIEEPDKTDGLTPKDRKALEVLRVEFGVAGARATEWQKAAKRHMSASHFYRCKSTLIGRGLVVENESRFYPAPDPSGSDNESSESGLDKPNSWNSHLLSSYSHESNESGGNTYSHRSPPPYRGESESNPESTPPDDIVGEV